MSRSIPVFFKKDIHEIAGIATKLTRSRSYLMSIFFRDVLENR